MSTPHSLLSSTASMLDASRQSFFDIAHSLAVTPTASTIQQWLNYRVRELQPYERFVTELAAAAVIADLRVDQTSQLAPGTTRTNFDQLHLAWGLIRPDSFVEAPRGLVLTEWESFFDSVTNSPASPGILPALWTSYFTSKAGHKQFVAMVDATRQAELSPESTHAYLAIAYQRYTLTHLAQATQTFRSNSQRKPSHNAHVLNRWDSFLQQGSLAPAWQVAISAQLVSDALNEYLKRTWSKTPTHHAKSAFPATRGEPETQLALAAMNLILDVPNVFSTLSQREHREFRAALARALHKEGWTHYARVLDQVHDAEWRTKKSAQHTPDQRDLAIVGEYFLRPLQGDLLFAQRCGHEEPGFADPIHCRAIPIDITESPYVNDAFELLDVSRARDEIHERFHLETAIADGLLVPVPAELTPRNSTQWFFQHEGPLASFFSQKSTVFWAQLTQCRQRRYDRLHPARPTPSSTSSFDDLNTVSFVADPFGLASRRRSKNGTQPDATPRYLHRVFMYVTPDGRQHVAWVARGTPYSSPQLHKVDLALSDSGGGTITRTASQDVLDNSRATARTSLALYNEMRAAAHNGLVRPITTQRGLSPEVPYVLSQRAANAVRNAQRELHQTFTELARTELTPTTPAKVDQCR